MKRPKKEIYVKLQDVQKTRECSEMFLEDKMQISIESLKAFADFVFDYKFTVQHIFGNSTFEEIMKKIQTEGIENDFVSEKCIDRSSKLLQLEQIVEDKTLNKEIFKANVLWSTIIDGNILPLETFWCMEYTKNKGDQLTDREERNLKFLKDIALIYLDKTEYLTMYFDEYKIGT